jgi:hypothetical protein
LIRDAFDPEGVLVNGDMVITHLPGYSPDQKLSRRQINEIAKHLDEARSVRGPAGQAIVVTLVKDLTDDKLTDTSQGKPILGDCTIANGKRLVTQIRLNTKAFDGSGIEVTFYPKKRRKRYRSTIPKGLLVVWHEYGHATQRHKLDSAESEKLRRWYEDERLVKNPITEYGARDEDETYAEMFVHWMLMQYGLVPEDETTLEYAKTFGWKERAQ